MRFTNTRRGKPDPAWHPARENPVLDSYGFTLNRVH